MATTPNKIKIFRLQSWAGYNENDDLCEEYVRYYSDDQYIYLVSIEEESRERFCRIKASKKQCKYIKYPDWEEYHTYTYGVDEIRVHKKL